MEYLDKETQMIAVEKVLEEMKMAEEYLSRWNACWLETCADVYSRKLYNAGLNYVREMQEKYQGYCEFNEISGYGRKKIPLRKDVLIGYHEDKYPCEFGQIFWYGVNSNKSKRSFSFKNNGDIHFSKYVSKGPTIKKPKAISYEASYNVLSDDFFIDIIIDDYNEKRSKAKHMVMSLKGNILFRKYNGIEVMLDLNTGIKIVKIAKEYVKFANNASVVFEARFNADKVMEVGSVEICTHKGNGKVNGTYRLDASIKKGIRARFISRKGVKVDLNTNPILASNANNLLLPVLNSQDNEDMVISEFTSSTQNVIAQNLAERVIIFDNSDFNLVAIQEAEKSLTNIIKEIKGEIPLNGLTERINNCLELIDREQNLQIEDRPKVLRLETEN